MSQAGDAHNYQTFSECLSDSINFSYILAGSTRTRELFLENIQPNAIVCDSSDETSRREFWKIFHKVNQWEIAVECLMPVIYCIHTLQNLYAFGVCKSIHFLDSTRKQLGYVWVLTWFVTLCKKTLCTNVIPKEKKSLAKTRSTLIYTLTL